MPYPAKPIPAYPWTPACDPYIYPHIQVLSYHAPPSHSMLASAYAHIYPCEPSYAYFQGASPRLSEYYSAAFSNMKPNPTYERSYMPHHYPLPLGRNESRAFTGQLAEFALKEAGIVSSPSFSTTDEDSSFSCSSLSSPISPAPSEYFTPLNSSFSQADLSLPFDPARVQTQTQRNDANGMGSPSPPQSAFLPFKLDRPSVAERIRMAEALNIKSRFSVDAEDEDDEDEVFFDTIDLDFGWSSEEDDSTQGKNGEDDVVAKDDGKLDFRCRGE